MRASGDTATPRVELKKEAQKNVEKKTCSHTRAAKSFLVLGTFQLQGFFSKLFMIMFATAEKLHAVHVVFIYFFK